MTKLFKKMNWRLLSVIMLVVVASLWLAKQLLITPNISLIGSRDSDTCTTNVASFTLVGQCGNGKIKRADYICNDGQTGFVEGCLDPVKTFENAKNYCGATCTIAPTSSPQFCTAQAGSCMNINGQCSTFSDGCEMNKVCANPYQTCDDLKPTDCICPPGALCKLPASCNSPSITPKPSFSPIPKSSIKPGCYYEQVQCIKAPCKSILVCPSPVPTSTTISTAYPSATVLPLPKYSPTPGCGSIFGRNICLPWVKPLVD